MMNKSSISISDWLAEATHSLVFNNIPSGRLDAELLLAHTLKKPRTWLHGHGDEPLEARANEIANARLDLRLDRVPVAYIIGHKEFYGRRFKVTTSTLIPRPESESLIELLATAIPKNQSLLNERPLRVIDVGTGSGILGITAKLEHPELDVTLSDISRHALTVAEQNARALQADVSILSSNLLVNYPLVADIIIANLPYVDAEWERSPETDHEPASALFAAQNGLALIFELLIQTRSKLALGGKLILEADPEQHPAIIKEATKNGLVHVETIDYAVLLEKLK
jgi:release factor glutamine methyltransferase